MAAVFDEDESMGAIPFPKRVDTKSIWKPVRTGDWATDCATGRRLAQELTAELNTVALVAVIRTIVEQGEFGGVETGFFQALAEIVYTK